MLLNRGTGAPGIALSGCGCSNVGRRRCCSASRTCGERSGRRGEHLHAGHVLECVCLAHLALPLGAHALEEAARLLTLSLNVLKEAARLLALSLNVLEEAARLLALSLNVLELRAELRHLRL